MAEKLIDKIDSSQLSMFPETDWHFIQMAVDRVKTAWNMHKQLGSKNPMLLAFSGGKDSVCVYGICKRASEELGVAFDDMFFMQYNITNVDPPELVQFVKKQFPQCHLHIPKRTMWQLIVDKHLPPTMIMRYCCKELKEVSQIKGGFTLTGVRHAESARRAKRGALEILGKSKSDRILLNDNEDRRWIENCMQKNAYVCNPIIDWSDEEVWRFIKYDNLPYCSLYDEGWKRLGCIGCPFANYENRRREFARWPKYKDQYIRTFQKMLDAYSKIDIRTLRITFKDGNDVFDWWMRDPEFAKRHKTQDNEIFDFDEG